MKRVIAGPGDWVYIDDDGNVFVNGEELDEPYLQEKRWAIRILSILIKCLRSVGS